MTYAVNFGTVRMVVWKERDVRHSFVPVDLPIKMCRKTGRRFAGR